MCRCTLSARTLREAIELCGRYCAMLHPRAGRLSLERDCSLASVQLDSLRPETTTASSLADITGLFAFRQLFQWLVGADLRLRQVRIGPIERDDVLPFLLLFGAPVGIVVVTTTWVLSLGVSSRVVGSGNNTRTGSVSSMLS